MIQPILLNTGSVLCILIFKPKQEDEKDSLTGSTRFHGIYNVLAIITIIAISSSRLLSEFAVFACIDVRY